LLISLVTSSLRPAAGAFSLLVVPVGLCIISGSALLGNRLILRSKTQKGFRFKQTIVIGARKEPKKSLIQKKVLKPLQSAKLKVEFGFHTCPVQGIEKCAGNYLNLHSCNSASQTEGKQIFWKEITHAPPAK